MKRVYASLGVAGMIGLAYLTFTHTEVVEYVKPTVIKETVEVTPDWAEDEDAVKAAQDVIQRKAWEAELTTVKASIADLEEKETELEKNLGTY